MIWSFQWISFPPASQYTLVTLERIKKRWEDGGAYFLIHVANKPKPKKVVPQNKKYFRNAVALKDSSKLLRQMSFLALIFTGFLTKFQEEGPFIHMLFHELQRMLSSLMLRFFKAEFVNWKALLDILIWRMKATNCPMNLCMLEWMLKHCWRSAARILGNNIKRRCKMLLWKWQHTFNQDCSWTTASWKIWYAYIHCKELKCLQIHFEELPNGCPTLYFQATFCPLFMNEVSWRQMMT